jgi:endoglucanase
MSWIRMNSRIAAVLAATVACVCGPVAALEYGGVSLAGAEFGEGNLPGIHGTHYTYPGQDEVDYFKSRGMSIVRLCFRWERLQPSLGADLESNELARLNGFVSVTTAKGMRVVLDPHNYARYHGNVIGSAQVPMSAFGDFWARLAGIYKTNGCVVFGLMNEPHDMATETWRDAAQIALNAIRATGATNLVLVPGNGWSGTHSWLQNWYGTPNGTALLGITDPASNFAFEVHQYLDGDSSGTTTSIVDEAIGATRLADFTQWCRTHNRRGFLGEFAAANSTFGTGRGDEAISNMLSHIEANGDVWVGWTWWAAGPWWGEYMFTLEPSGGFTIDRPAMGVLRRFLPIPVPRIDFVSSNRYGFVAWPGFRFQPEWRPDLRVGAWTNVGPELDGAATPVTVPVVPAAPVGYHRVRGDRAPQ